MEGKQDPCSENFVGQYSSTLDPVLLEVLIWLQPNQSEELQKQLNDPFQKKRAADLGFTLDMYVIISILISFISSLHMVVFGSLLKFWAFWPYVPALRSNRSHKAGGLLKLKACSGTLRLSTPWPDRLELCRTQPLRESERAERSFLLLKNAERVFN
jgi:hypothetical protein